MSGSSRATPVLARNVLLGLVLVTALAAGWFGWSWWSAAHDDDLDLARTRAAVVQAATDALVRLNTIDHRTAQADFDGWLRVSTGELGRSLSGDRKHELEQVRESQTVANATVATAAVTELDAHEGTARVIAVVDVEVSSNGQGPRPHRSLLDVQLGRTDAGWKVSGVQAAGS